MRALSRALIGALGLVLALAVLALTQPVAAQDCVLDKCLNGAGGGSVPATAPGTPAPSPPPPSGRILPAATGSFDFYVLALSWSPGFCDTGGESKAPDQCATGAGFGFVVHGLWPQNTHGFPSDCDSGSRFPSRVALDSVRGVYPDVGLARYEWRKHGTCTGLSPTDYFAAVRQARDGIVIPDALRHPAEPQTMAPLDIARAFAAANRGLRPDTMAVTCQQGELAEVRICLAKDLRNAVPCPEVARGSCRQRSISVMPVR